MKNAYELLKDFDEAILDCIYVSNEKLPDSFRDHRTDGVALRTLWNKCKEQDESDHVLDKRERERRVEIYRKQIEHGQEIEYLPHR